jgi:signal transduction histidine kinase
MVQSKTAIASLAIYNSNSYAWADALFDYLDKSGFELNRVNTTNTGSSLDGVGRSADVVIVVSKEDYEFAYNRLSNHRSINPSCLFIYITNDFSECDSGAKVDAILPAIPTFAEKYIKDTLLITNENSTLKKQTNQLSQKIKDLELQLEKQEKQSNEVEVLKNAIVRNVSHELRTPLIQVKAAVALLAEDNEDDELIRYAKNATARLETLVKNITSLGESLDIMLNPVIVRDSIEYACRNLGRIWEHKNAKERIHINISGEIPPALADKQGLSTALQLLIDNALKFSEDSVEVEVLKIEQGIKIAIKDKGIGISDKHLENIFETFFQVENSSTRRYGGTGVGLAISSLILDKHNSQIMVDSVVGKGSTFSFILPVAQL